MQKTNLVVFVTSFLNHSRHEFCNLPFKYAGQWIRGGGGNQTQMNRA